MPPSPTPTPSHHRAAALLVALAVAIAIRASCRTEHSPRTADGAPETHGWAQRAPQSAAGCQVDPNDAGARDFERLPRVGPALARRIVEERERLGRFSGPRDLARVRGIGARTLARMQPCLVWGSQIDREP